MQAFLLKVLLFSHLAWPRKKLSYHVKTNSLIVFLSCPNEKGMETTSAV